MLMAFLVGYIFITCSYILFDERLIFDMEVFLVLLVNVNWISSQLYIYNMFLYSFGREINI